MIRVEPLMLTGLPEGDRFALRVAPAASTPARGVLLCLQPFMDEATLARRVLVEQARRLADQGWFTLIPDLFGTGDSGGETQAATFEIWRNELPHWAALAREQTPSGPLVLWGTRMGCLLATQLSGLTNLPHHLLLWQPPMDGNSLLAPLRKLGRLKGEARGASGAGGTAATASAASDAAVAAPTETSAMTPAVERLAGYPLQKGLLEGLAGLTLAPSLANPAAGERHVLFLTTQRVVRDNPSQGAALSQREADWGARGWLAKTGVVQGEPFWTSMEPVTPVATFARTLAWLGELPTTSDEPSGALALSDERILREIGKSSVDSRVSEQAMVMTGHQGLLFGVLSHPTALGEHTAPRRAALIVAGQPQTRVGSHRMFVELARALSAQGIVCLRFDVGGWGDSPGEACPFEQSASDIAMAAAALAKAAGTEARAPVALWIGGLCDGATAAMLALPAVQRQAVEPAGVFLLNPWVRSDASLGEAMIRNYYARRILDPAFWRRLFSGRVSLGNLVREPWRYWRAASKVSAAASTPEPADASTREQNQTTTAPNTNDLATTFIRCREAFTGQVVTVLSGNDLTAAETEALIAANPRWQRGLDSGKAAVLRAAAADHTFSADRDWALVSGWIGQQILR